MDPSTVVAVLQDWAEIIAAVGVIAGTVWAVVTRSNRKLQDLITDITDRQVTAVEQSISVERDRVDDLTSKTSTIEQRLGVIERRIEDLYHLLVSVIDPRRLRESPQPDGRRADDPPHGTP